MHRGCFNKILTDFLSFLHVFNKWINTVFGFKTSIDILSPDIVLAVASLSSLTQVNYMQNVIQIGNTEYDLENAINPPKHF